MERALDVRQELDENPSGIVIVATIAIVMAVIGLGWSLLSLVGSLVGGGFMLSAGSNVGGIGAQGWLLWVQLGIGLTSNILSAGLCVGIVAGAIAAFGRRPRPLQLLSVLSIVYIAVFDILVYVGQQITSLAVSYQSLQGIPGLPTGGPTTLEFVIGMSVAVVTFMVLVAVARIAFWAVTWATIRRALQNDGDTRPDLGGPGALDG